MNIFASAFLVFALALPASAFDVPRLAAPVNDHANMISRKVEKQLNRSLKNFRRQGGAQIAVLTVPSLQGESIEQASIQVVDRWKLGDAKSDQGVLLLIAKEDRQMRIEVGQGLEGSLTDLHAKRIITDTMVPLFKQGEIEKGILLGLHQVASKTNPEIQLFSGKATKKWKQKRKRSVGMSDLFTIIVFILLMIFGGRSTMFGFLLGSMMGGGRRYGGGFSGGGGGFSGGGGGFSGGGASGSW